MLSLLVALAVAVPLGVAAALHRGKLLDALVSVFALLGLSIPGFFLGILLILLFSLKLRWLPPAGYVPFAEAPLANLEHMVLPAVSLGLVLAAALTRIVRSSMLEVLSRDFVRTARSKGWPSRGSPTGTRCATRSYLLLRSSVCSSGRCWAAPSSSSRCSVCRGVGRFALEGINLRDYPVVQGAIIFIAGAFILVNLLVDLLYSLIDPRIRYG